MNGTVCCESCDRSSKQCVNGWDSTYHAYTRIGELNDDVEQLFDAGTSVRLIEVVAKSSSKAVEHRMGAGRIRVEVANEAHYDGVEPFIQPRLCR